MRYSHGCRSYAKTASNGKQRLSGQRIVETKGRPSSIIIYHKILEPISQLGKVSVLLLYYPITSLTRSIL